MQIIKAIKDEYNIVYNIMLDNFNNDELRTRENHLKLYYNYYFNCDLIKINNNIVAFICYYILNDYIFIEHIAVDKNYQGLKLGSNLINHIKSKNMNIILEVELPNTDINIRRISFYNKLDFILDNNLYIQPRMEIDRDEIELKLMSYPNNINDFQYIKETLYKYIYNKY